ncbi:efflux RND transporter periplasmic adaptor subunit [Pseudocolwellia sp. HL-MZ7]|uniref:efflux RND transporter periplasmic adaptor subunit n=1 Tax=Pseudocolwellia sp. HL-MZ7 TaxID=3400627 RepID=UPI003CEED555
MEIKQASNTPKNISKNKPKTETFQKLLQFEADIRDQKSDMELLYHMANETRCLLNYGQAFVFKKHGSTDEMKVNTVSSMAVVDRNSPAIRWIERLILSLSKDVDLEKMQEFKASAYAEPQDPETTEYPFINMIWVPLKQRDGTCFAGILLARLLAWPAAEKLIAERLAGTYSHAWMAFTPHWTDRRKPWLTRIQKRIAIIAVIVIALIPVRLSVLAPVRVVAERPFILSSPTNGVVERIHVPPNAEVKKGQLIVSLEDMLLRNDAAMASEKLKVAAVRYERAKNAAFSDNEAARDIAVTKSEYHLAEAEANYAQGVLERAQLRAPQDGIAVYSDRRDWEGRPVSVGEHIVEIADPNKVEFIIELPLRDLIEINPEAKVTVYLDNAPLSAVSAEVARSSYHSSRLPDGREAFLLAAKPIETTDDIQIGAHGSARVYGGWVPLIYRILRRPIAATRQGIGL